MCAARLKLLSESQAEVDGVLDGALTELIAGQEFKGAAGSSATEVSSEVSSPPLSGHRGMRCQARRWVLMSRPGSNVFDSCDRRCSLARARLLGLPLRLALA